MKMVARSRTRLSLSLSILRPSSYVPRFFFLSIFYPYVCSADAALFSPRIRDAMHASSFEIDFHLGLKNGSSTNVARKTSHNASVSCTSYRNRYTDLGSNRVTFCKSVLFFFSFFFLRNEIP